MITRRFLEWKTRRRCCINVGRWSGMILMNWTGVMRCWVTWGLVMGPTGLSELVGPGMFLLWRSVSKIWVRASVRIVCLRRSDGWKQSAGPLFGGTCTWPSVLCGFPKLGPPPTAKMDMVSCCATRQGGGLRFLVSGWIIFGLN